MKLVVPYAPGHLRGETLLALAMDGQDPVLEPVEGDSGYWHLLKRLWRGVEDLVIVEHDIVVRAGCIAELVECDQAWCAFGYPYIGYGLWAGLGCVKFSAQCQRKVENLLDRVSSASPDRQHPPRHWCRLDSHIRRELLTFRIKQHIHRPAVDHLGNGHAAHGCA